MVKKVFKFFTVDNFEKEETYLREMAQKGWHFKKFQGLRYFFEKGDSQDIYYRIDYHSPADGDRDDYIQLFEDSGWSLAFAYPVLDGEWMYFRKDSNSPGITEIFTDSSSKINLFRKIRRRWSAFVFIFLACGFLPSFTTGIALEKPFLLFFNAILIGGIGILYGKMIVNLTRKIQKLQQ